MLVVAGCSGLGIWYRARLQDGIIQLQRLKQLLELLMSEIRYHNATLPESCRLAGKRMPRPWGEALLQIWEKLEKDMGMGFGESWREEIGLHLEDLPISEREKEVVLGVAECEGFCDAAMQLSALEQHRDLLEDTIKRRKEQLQEQGRMAVGLGILGGLLLVIVFL